MNSWPKTATGQHHGYDVNPGPSVPESSTLITQLMSHDSVKEHMENISCLKRIQIFDKKNSKSRNRNVHRISIQLYMMQITTKFFIANHLIVFISNEPSDTLQTKVISAKVTR